MVRADVVPAHTAGGCFALIALAGECFGDGRVSRIVQVREHQRYQPSVAAWPRIWWVSVTGRLSSMVWRHGSDGRAPQYGQHTRSGFTAQNGISSSAL